MKQKANKTEIKKDGAFEIKGRMWLMLSLSALICASAICLPVFSAIGFNEPVVDYGLEYVDIFSGFYTISSPVFLHGIENENAWTLALSVISHTMFLLGIALFIAMLPWWVQEKKEVKPEFLIKLIKSFYWYIVFLLLLNTVYTLVTSYLAFSVLSGEKYLRVNTYSLISFLPQIPVFAYATHMRLHLKKVINQQENNALFVPSKKDNLKMGHSAASSEKDKVEMLRKYKKLCDQGVITREEYEEKKEEILN